MKRMIKHTMLAALALAGLAACVDDRNNFMVDDSFSLTGSQLVVTSVHTGEYSFGVNKAGKGQSAGSVRVVTDGYESALKLYNYNNSTEYKALPANLYSVSGANVSFDASDINKQVKVTWNVEALAEAIGTDGSYVIPLRIVSDDLEVNGEKDFIMINPVRSSISVTQGEQVRSIEEKAVLPDESGKAPELQEDIILDVENTNGIKGVSMTFPVEVDQSLVAVYDDAHEDEYVAAPEGLVTILTPTATIPAGSTSARIQVRLDKSMLLEGGALKKFPNYVVPVRLGNENMKAEKDGSAFDLKGLDFENTVTYIVVKRAAEGIEVVVRSWGKYSPSAAWYSYLDGFASGADRTIAMDNKHVYVAHSNGTPGLYALSISNGELVKKLDVSPAADNGCTFPVSCVRVVPNTSGDDVVIFSSLKGDGDQHLYVYAYTNGVDAAPVQILDYLKDVKPGDPDWRRYGDRFTVKGTWQDGELWFHTWSGDSRGKTVVFKLVNGVITNPDDPVDYLIDGDGAGIKDIVLYPGFEDVMVAKVSGAGVYHNTGDDSVNKWIKWAKTTDLPDIAMTYGYNFFTFHGKKYMAFVRLEGENATKGRLIIIDDESKSPAQFVDQLQAQAGYREFPIQHEEDFEAKSAVPAASTVGDCVVKDVNGVTYVAVLVQGCGLSLFQLQ